MEKLSTQAMRLAQQFDAGHHEYATFIETDPVRNHLHYPSVIKELGDAKAKRILDIGCGDGLFDRNLAKKFGAEIIGYDRSSNLIAKAEAREKEISLGIKYMVADPLNFREEKPFDSAVAVMVLPYSPDAGYLKNFFASAYNNLKAGGKFVAVVFNPEFNSFNRVVANRFFRKADEGKVNFDFLAPDSKEVKFNAALAQFSKEDYERGAKDGGFAKLEWKALLPDEEGLKKFGEDFWKQMIESQPYALIIAER